ncbi:hypothetical protein [Frigidibacter sp. MR17.24]|uniref:hypothetical protein n=1 Tax=Frigidibacter sp. MR17.24 TaxID=3127345 RepID=UPI003012A89D
MDPDRLLVFGAVIFVMGIPALVSAWTDERHPWVAGLAFLTGAGLIGLAWYTSPDGYRLSELPHVFYGTIGGMLH